MQRNRMSHCRSSNGYPTWRPCSVTTATIIVAITTLLVASCGRSFIYQPTQLAQDEVASLAKHPGWRVDRIPIREPAGSLVGLVRPASTPTDPWLLLFAGNATSLSMSQSMLERIAQSAPWGLAVWAYRGYDGSAGQPAQARLLRDAETVAAHLHTAYKVAPRRLALIGHSLGTGIAAHLALHLQNAGPSPAAGIVLLAPYTSLAEVVDNETILPMGWAVSDPFRSKKIYRQLETPALIIHGGKDNVIPPSHGRQVAALMAERAFVMERPNRGHNDLLGDKQVLKRIRTFILQTRQAQERAFPTPAQSPQPAKQPHQRNRPPATPGDGSAAPSPPQRKAAAPAHPTATTTPGS